MCSVLNAEQTGMDKTPTFMEFTFKYGENTNISKNCTHRLEIGSRQLTVRCQGPGAGKGWCLGG